MKILRKITILFFVMISFYGFSQEVKFSEGLLIIHSLSGEEHFFTIEIAESPEQLQQGLMFRRELEDNDGMLFNFGSPRKISMWMKNTFISLDMIFISKEDRTEKIIRNTTPLSENILFSDTEIIKVLEIKGGQSDVLGIKVGDYVSGSLSAN